MKKYIVHQFTDTNLVQYGYLIISNGEAAVVDPARDVRPIREMLQKEGATLKAIIETHPHADFVSGHLELHTVTGAPIYISKLLGATYEHRTFDTGDTIAIGHVTLASLNTPGHSPDSISILLRDENGIDQALFSGDTLFVGDVGRPDLCEKAGNIQAKREELAAMMFDTVQNVLKPLADHVIVYPAHGAGTLCGKALRDAPLTTIGEERLSNPAFQDMSREAFVTMLTDGQPMIPQYFGYDVSINRNGAPNLRESLSRIETLNAPAHTLIVDTRDAKHYNAGHLLGVLHVPEDGLRFETWLGTIVRPDERITLIVQDAAARTRVLERVAKIGYEQQVVGVVVGDIGDVQAHRVDFETFRAHADDYHVIDVRQPYENEQSPLFQHAMNIPLNELRNRTADIPTTKPLAVHCAGGYRSMVAESILTAALNVPVFDIGEDVRRLSCV